MQQQQQQQYEHQSPGLVRRRTRFQGHTLLLHVLSHSLDLTNLSLTVLQYLHSTPLTSTPPPMANNTNRGRRVKAARRESSPYASSSPSRSASPKRKTRQDGKVKERQCSQTQHSTVYYHQGNDYSVRDIPAYVNRNTETRHAEVTKRKNGHITRPMNSFMLYRSAYAERTKAWARENNHQVVSAVAGASWPLEPPVN